LERIVSAIFPTFGSTGGGVFEPVGDDAFLPSASGGNAAAGGGGISDIFTGGVGAILNASLTRVANGILDDDSQRATVILKKQEARRKRRAEASGVKTKSVVVAVAVSVVALVGLSMFFRK
jgi:hypothetical protein